MLIEGPKWCEKTTIAKQIASIILCVDNPERRQQNLAMAELSPKQLLKEAAPRLIDEWQLTPKLWLVIRFEVDHRGEMVPFILMGAGDYAYRQNDGVYVVPVGSLKTNCRFLGRCIGSLHSFRSFQKEYNSFRG